jgi:hypothetical protein
MAVSVGWKEVRGVLRRERPGSNEMVGGRRRERGRLAGVGEIVAALVWRVGAWRLAEAPEQQAAEPGENVRHHGRSVRMRSPACDVSEDLRHGGWVAGLTNSSSATEAGHARADYEETPVASLCSLERVVRGRPLQSDAEAGKTWPKRAKTTVVCDKPRKG